MKRLLIGLLALGSISAFAGSLVSNDSLERVNFDFNSSTGVLTIESFTAHIESSQILLEIVSRDRSSIKLFAATGAITEDGMDNVDTAGMLSLPATVTYDLILLPFKATIKGLTNTKYQKDYNLLMSAINSDEGKEITVSSKRFERIMELLKP